MAFLAQDDKQQQQPGQDPGTQGQAGASGSGFAGSSGGSTSTQPSTAGVGSGGTGGWTNIQSYLQANQGNSNSANYLNQNAQNTYDQENKNFQDQSSQAKQQGQQQADSENVNQDAATKMINNAAQYYQYNTASPQTNGAAGSVPGQTSATGSGQSDQYGQALQPIQQLLTAKYQGPSSFSYGMGADAQRYAQLGDDQAYHGVMNDLYNKAAGGTMGAGSLALQQQIDQDNPALNQARQNILGQYSGLQSQEQQGTQDTNAALQNAQNQFTQNQQNFRNTLTGMGGQDKSAIDQAVQQFNASPTSGANANNIDFSTFKTSGDAANIPYSYAGAQPGSTDFIKSAFGANGNPLLQKWLTDELQAKGGNANEGNVAGVDQQRNSYNVIQNALGLGGTINQDATAASGPKYSFDPNQLSNDVNDVYLGQRNNQAQQDYANWIQNLLGQAGI